MLSTILIIVLILLLIGALLSRLYSWGRGYGSTGGLGLVVVIVVILVLLGYIWHPVQPPCARGSEYRLTGHRGLAAHRSGADVLRMLDWA